MTFNVDHSKLNPGIYINNAKVIGEKEVVTYDIRLCAPYKEPVMSNAVMHSIEHILAVNLEEVFSELKGYERIYFGPMGCQTGFYLIVANPIEEFEPENVVLGAIQKACLKGLCEEVVPFSTEKECGNCKTLTYDVEVQTYLYRMSSLTDSIKKYTYIEEEEPKVLTKYVVRFGGNRLVIESDLLTLQDIMKCYGRADGNLVKFRKELRRLHWVKSNTKQ